MFTCWQKTPHITSTYSKQNINFFHLHFTILFMHTYKIVCRKTYFSQFLKDNWKITLYHSFPELKCLINISHLAPSNCQFPHSVHLRLVQDKLARYYSECADEAYCTILVDQKVDPLPYHCLQVSFLYNVCRCRWNKPKESNKCNNYVKNWAFHGLKKRYVFR